MRHTLGSHLDQAGFNLSMIQAILRHESPNTSQIYIHTEEKQRREAMQKIKMDIEPRIISQKEEKLRTELKLRLKGGPLSEVLGLERFISVLENNIFKGFNWIRKEVLEELIQHYQKIRILKEPLEITYMADGTRYPEEVENIKKAIVREAEIRLFDCHLQIVVKSVI